MRWLVFLALFGCHVASPPARCDVTGDWRADLILYDGTAQITARDHDALELTLVGKGTQEGHGRWRDARHVVFDLAWGESRCEIASDCRRIACERFTLDR